MSSRLTYEELLKKVKQHEDTLTQLVRIVASTNHRITEIQVKQETMEKSVIK